MKDEKQYNVPLTVKEMQYIANSLGAYFEILAREKFTVSPERAVSLATAMKKMRKAAEVAEGEPLIVLDLN